MTTANPLENVQNLLKKSKDFYHECSPLRATFENGDPLNLHLIVKLYPEARKLYECLRAFFEDKNYWDKMVTTLEEL